MTKKSNENLIELLQLFIKAKNPDLIVQLSELFFTAEEQVSFANRFLIVKNLIEAKKSQRDIAKDLGVSIANITRGSNELKRMDDDLHDYLKKMI